MTHEISAAAVDGHRKDIDGLRAVSVLAVILYHFGFGLPGGFVGVDVFFVISGYLITSIIYREMANGRFSIAGFYDRRIRRILPATLFVILCTLVAGYFILLPADYAGLGSSAVAASVGASNIFFWLNTGGYFDEATDLLPLLHTWSLGVEEQFYLLWPLCLLLIFRIFGSNRLWPLLFLTAVLVASLAASIIITPTDQPQAFYLLHSRAWELALGGLLVFLPALRPRLISELAPLVGLGLIAAALTLFTSETPFPSYSALLPCVGAALILWPADRQSLGSRLLSLPPLPFIGAISFSAYLWHWPLLVMYRHYGSTELPAQGERLALAVATLGVAAASWKWIERPFRSWRPKFRVSIIGGIAAALVVAGGGFIISYSGGAPFRLSAQALYYQSFTGKIEPSPGKDACFLRQSFTDFDPTACLLPTMADKINVLLIGDSHSAMYAKALRELGDGISVSQATASGCTPVIPLTGADRCTGLLKGIFDRSIGVEHYDVVIVAARWGRADIAKLPETISALKTLGDRVFLIGRVVEYTSPLVDLLTKSVLSGNQQAIALSSKYKDMKKLDGRFVKALKGTGVTYLSSIDAICPGGKCEYVTPTGEPFQFDYGHLTTAGAGVVLRRLGLDADLAKRD
ncbi:MAG: hypothetical protein JWR75_585 [Devosia sp.]|nr:hypothetical protein [Devosia sp.]